MTHKKVMVVTGASCGIRAAVARLAGRSGYAGCVNYLKNGRAADHVLAGIRSDGSDGMVIL